MHNPKTNKIVETRNVQWINQVYDITEIRLNVSQEIIIKNHVDLTIDDRNSCRLTCDLGHPIE